MQDILTDSSCQKLIENLKHFDGPLLYVEALLNFCTIYRKLGRTTDHDRCLKAHDDLLLEYNMVDG